MIRPPVADIQRAIQRALQEDLPLGDVTTTALFPSPTPALARIVAQQSLVVAGLAAAARTFRTVDASLVFSIHRQDGERAKDGDCLLQIEGDGRSILKAERVALNFLQHLSGIATLTRRFCDAVRGYPVTILDTRKTIPGFRALQKWAVRLGGGTNHRQSLSDAILIKDNHLALLNQTTMPVRTACRKAKANAPRSMKIIVEVESLADVRQAVVIAGGDPLNLVGILIPGAKVSPHSNQMIALENGCVAEIGLLGALRSRLQQKVSAVEKRR